MSASAQPRPIVLLRPVPGRSLIHDLWPGTKLVAVFGISVLLTFYPGWVTIGLMASLVLISARLAHIPRGVVPSLPWWFWLVIVLGAVTGALGGGSPYVALGPVELGLGGLLNFLKVAAVALVLLGLCGMVSWTTNVADVAPAIATLGRPLRLLRLPVDDYAVAIALALRAFPMLIDEFRVLYAAWKLRPRPIPGPTRRARHRQRLREVIDLVASAITVALRRGDEMGDAITARGGTGQISAAPSRPKLADWVALSTVTAVCAVAVALELTVLAPST